VLEILLDDSSSPFEVSIFTSDDESDECVNNVSSLINAIGISTSKISHSAVV
jgi:hypothetical protein